MDSTSTSDPSKSIIRLIVLIVGVLVAALVLWPKAQERFAPTPVRAHVAIQPAGSEVAVVGPVEIEPGREFTLHAVLEAEGRGGAPVYYTEAPALEIGGERVSADALLVWDRPWVTKVFWFTVEGPAPYVEVKALEHIGRVSFTEYFHPEWPLVWSIPGALTSHYDQSLARDSETEGRPAGRRTFGTQRYQVRIELFEDEESLTPTIRLTSPGGDALPAEVDTFSTVYAPYPGPAEPASLAFGLTQVEPVDAADGEMIRRLAELTERRIFVSRLPLVREVIRATGLSPDQVAWTEVDLEAGPAWAGAAEASPPTKALPAGVSRGDLLRAGGRVVVLYEDQGAPGRLDRGDLCFDYEQGARVLPLSDVFEGEGLLELALLRGGADQTK